MLEFLTWRGCYVTFILHQILFHMVYHTCRAEPGSCWYERGPHETHHSLDNNTPRARLQFMMMLYAKTCSIIVVEPYIFLQTTQMYQHFCRYFSLWILELYFMHICIYIIARGILWFIPRPPRLQTLHRLRDNLRNSYRIAFIFYMYIDIGDRIAGKQDGTDPIIYGPPRAPRIAKNAHFCILWPIYEKLVVIPPPPLVIHMSALWWGLTALIFSFTWVQHKDPPNMIYFFIFFIFWV